MDEAQRCKSVTGMRPVHWGPAVTDIGSLVFDCGGDTAVNNPISGTGSLTQEGAFTVTLDGGNSYSGGTEIDAGNLAFGSTAAIGTGNASGNITVNDGGQLDVPGPYTTVTQWLAGGTINTGSNGALALTGDSSEWIDMTGYDSLSLARPRMQLLWRIVEPRQQHLYFRWRGRHADDTERLGRR